MACKYDDFSYFFKFFFIFFIQNGSFSEEKIQILLQINMLKSRKYKNNQCKIMLLIFSKLGAINHDTLMLYFRCYFLL